MTRSCTQQWSINMHEICRNSEREAVKVPALWTYMEDIEHSKAKDRRQTVRQSSAVNFLKIGWWATSLNVERNPFHGVRASSSFSRIAQKLVSEAAGTAAQMHAVSERYIVYAQYIFSMIVLVVPCYSQIVQKRLRVSSHFSSNNLSFQNFHDESQKKAQTRTGIKRTISHLL